MTTSLIIELAPLFLTIVALIVAAANYISNLEKEILRQIYDLRIGYTEICGEIEKIQHQLEKTQS